MPLVLSFPLTWPYPGSPETKCLLALWGYSCGCRVGAETVLGFLASNIPAEEKKNCLEWGFLKGGRVVFQVGHRGNGEGQSENPVGFIFQT